MYRYKRILVNLQLDDGDLQLIQHAAAISKMAQSEKIYLFYSEPKMDIPSSLIMEYPQLSESVADYARKKIQENLEKVFDDTNKLEQVILIQEGQTLDEILKQARINGIDLIITGVSEENSLSHGLAIKLARKAPCSVLVAPEKAPLNLEKPAVAVDFSDYSADAMDAALAFTRAAEGSELKTVNVCQVPSGYYKTGKSFDEFTEIMENHAVQNMEEFKKRFNLENIRITAYYYHDSKVVEALTRAIHEHGITFMAVGARGRSAGTAVMLGSVSEHLIKNINIPLLAVKKKGTGLSILEAIFS